MATIRRRRPADAKAGQRQTLTVHGIALHGEMAERSNAAVLKTADGDEPSVGSNPTLS